ncbi:signal recognition particle-docking protein FtsY [Marinomonas flavescens]|uniref:signal recognition particle-docking protein FtsY n=1 Tax=Marinomonas flavescens TaxID=2529379 RepID=UPI001056C6A3|nr:signal recognition particle-docking protein FtsY [Marinomonas flavescens]
MELVNQLIALLTPYLGEYARYAPIVIGTALAILAIVIKRRTVKSLRADIKSAKKKGTEEEKTEQLEETSSSSDALEQEVSAEQSAKSMSEGAVEAETTSTTMEHTATAIDKTPEKPTLSWSQRIKSGLSRTRNGLGSGLSSIISGSKKVDEDLLEELETQLLMADVGIDATQSLMDELTDKLKRKELKDADALLASLKAQMQSILVGSQKELVPVNQEGPFVILMVGVNGVGKTTTIGKLAKKYQQDGKSVMLAAGDTFRAAAVEQLQVWGERNNVPVVAQHTGADSASVIYDAIESAKAKGIDIVIADTAGRLQNKTNLMNELSKVVRVMQKLDVKAPHEVMLVLDAGTGQNALSQAKLFTETVGVSGITLTKLDGTAKGGIIFAIAKQFGLPIRYIGVGEQVDDLRPFVAEEFIDALFDSE